MKRLYTLLVITMLMLLTSCAQLPSGNRGASGAKTPPATIKRIALLLPLSGAVSHQAKAIQSGFFAAYYQARDTNGTAPQISVIDTGRTPVKQAYQQAVKNGANIVIGPLLKNNVTKLAADNNLTVPVLALNTTDYAGSRSNDAMFEFGLSPEAEASQTAAKILASGYQHALMITPAGRWGNGIAQAFRQRFQQGGGQIVDELSITRGEILSTPIKNLLHFKGSVRTATDDEQKMPPQDRRRQDFDVIFMAVSPTQGRQIKPLLNFYFASKIPVYATSMIFNGHLQSHANNDLDNVIFGDMPWAVQGIASTESSQKQPRLYAFGEDAYALSSKLGYLADGGSINGATGTLYLTQNLHINRVLSWGIFKNGLAQPLS